MSSLRMRVALIVALVMTCIAVTDAQQPATGAQPTRDGGLTPLTLQVVISRFQGEKKVSNLPYAIAVIANGGRASLRMGAQVPMQTTTPGPDGKPVVTSLNYRDVGTAIDCGVISLDGGRYSIQLTVEDSSVYSDKPAASNSPDLPTFRTFKATNSLVLREGQTGQFTMATDKVTGEVTKVDVTLTVSK
jgi:hypothetical protein